MMQQRLEWVDIAKGVGIVLVVLGHLNRGLNGAGISHQSVDFQVMDTTIYAFHMPLFFFLSGLFFESSLRNKSLTQNLGNKYNSLLHPYLIWSFIYALLGVVLANLTTSSIGSSALYTFLWVPAGHMWFLYALFVINLVAILIQASGISIGNRPLSSIMLILLGISLYLVAENISGVAALNRAAANSLYLILGLAVMRYVPLAQFKLPRAMVLLIAVIAIGLHFSYQTKIAQSEELFYLPPVQLLLALVSILCICSVSARVPTWLGANQLAVLGRKSIEIYLLHILLMVGCRVLLQRFLGVEDYWVHFFAGLSAGLVGSLLVATMIDRLGLSGLFRGKFQARLAN